MTRKFYVASKERGSQTPQPTQAPFYFNLINFFSKSVQGIYFHSSKEHMSETSEVATKLDFHPLVRSTHNFLPESFSVVIENKNANDYMQMSFFKLLAV